MSWSVKFLKKFPQTSKQPLTSLTGTKRREARPNSLANWQPSDSTWYPPEVYFKNFGRPSPDSMGNTAPQNFVSLLRLCNSSFELIEINFYANLNSDRTQLKHFPANPLSPFLPSLILKSQGHCVQNQNLISSKIEASWRQAKWRRKRNERNNERMGRMRCRKHAGRGQ